jgi:transposase-like protein
MFVKRGKFKRATGEVQRYFCKGCRQTFSSSALSHNGDFHRSDILPEVFRLYTSGYTESRLVQELGVSKETILKTITYLGEKCRDYHYGLLTNGLISIDFNGQDFLR